MKTRELHDFKPWMLTDSGSVRADPSNPFNNPGTVTRGFFDPDRVRGASRSYWRFCDEPGCYRDRAGKLVPLEELQFMPGLDAEIEERRHIETKAMARRIVSDALAGRTGEIIERIGALALERTADNMYRVLNGSGSSPITPDVSEEIARNVMATLAARAKLLDDGTDRPLDQMLEGAA